MRFNSLTSDVSVQFSCSVVSDSLQPHGLQHTRPPCPSPTLRVYSNSCPSSRWCHPTISSSVVPFFSHLQSFPDQGLFKWVSSSHQVAKEMEFQLQHQSFQWILRTDLLSGVISPLISSSILGTCQPGESIFQCPIFLPFHAVSAVNSTYMINLEI